MKNRIRNQAPENRGRPERSWATAMVKGLVTAAENPKVRASILMPRPVRLSHPRARARGTRMTIRGTRASYTPTKAARNIMTKMMMPISRYLLSRNLATMAASSACSTPPRSSTVKRAPQKNHKQRQDQDHEAIVPQITSTGAVNHRHTGKQIPSR